MMVLIVHKIVLINQVKKILLQVGTLHNFKLFILLFCIGLCIDNMNKKCH